MFLHIFAQGLFCSTVFGKSPSEWGRFALQEGGRPDASISSFLWAGGQGRSGAPFKDGVKSVVLCVRVCRVRPPDPGSELAAVLCSAEIDLGALPTNTSSEANEDSTKGPRAG